MTSPRVRFLVLLTMALLSATVAAGALQEPVFREADTQAAPVRGATDYVLGPDDVIAINALDAEEVSSPSIRIDPSGYISLPLLGRLLAAGHTVESLEKDLSTRLKVYVKEPVIAVTIVEYRSQPVSVIGAVNQSGVHRLAGRKTLIEILAEAGGLRPEAGSLVKITRTAEWGMIPLESAVMDETGQFSVAEVSLNGIIQATNPEDNIIIFPNDVISVPRAHLVYVIGEVRRPGGFVLNERRTVSGLHAVAMAEGFTAAAAPQRAIVLRPSGNSEHVEIAANLRDILNGKANDLELLPDDILFVPNSAARTVLGRTLQTALSAITSTAIYRGF